MDKEKAMQGDGIPKTNRNKLNRFSEFFRLCGLTLLAVILIAMVNS